MRRGGLHRKSSPHRISATFGLALHTLFETIEKGGNDVKLLRYGAAGQEKPGLLDAQGVLRDLSGIIPDVARCRPGARRRRHPLAGSFRAPFQQH